MEDEIPFCHCFSGGSVISTVILYLCTILCSRELVWSVSFD